MSNLDKILQYILTKPKWVYTSDIVKELFENLNEGQANLLIEEIHNHIPKIADARKRRFDWIIMPNDLTKPFLDNGGFTKIEDDLKVKEQKELNKESLEIEIKQLTKDNLEYQKTIRAQSDRIRNLDEQTKFINLIKLYWWVVFILIAIGIFLKELWDLILQEI